MPPGFSFAFILGALLVGAAFTVINTVYGYIEHLNSGPPPEQPRDEGS
jgi:predicted outer membrane lipoprotein